ncbi:endocuticle structural glycoprotein SgAbd-4 [Hermetia illucens]|nr:endocuticle structural glycoprotein SgAbd-4 [Hermetia illucens]
MFKCAVFCVIFFAAAFARPQSNDPTPIPIVAQYSNNAPDGSFNTTYETGNGIKVQNSGYIKRIHVPAHEDESGKLVEEHEEDIIVQVGSFSYTDTDGNVISLSYIADENGFQPTGDHLPKAPQPDQTESFARSVGQPQQQQFTQQPQPFSLQPQGQGQF